MREGEGVQLDIGSEEEREGTELNGQRSRIGGIG
jgi:hypothetical protein